VPTTIEQELKMTVSTPRARWSFRGRFKVLSFVAFAGLIVAILIFTQPARSGVAASNPRSLSTGAPVKVSYPVNLPDGYAPPTGMAAGTHGVWFIAGGSIQGAVHETVFHYDSQTKQLDKFEINTRLAALRAGYLTPMIVGNNGNAWLGINQSLLQIDPYQGIISDIALPKVSVSSLSSGLPRPPGSSPSSMSSIESLAIGPEGKIYIARDLATSIQIFDPRSRTVTSKDVPADTTISGTGENVLASHDDNATVDVILYAGHGASKIGELTHGAWITQSQTCSPLRIIGRGNDLIVEGSSNCFAIQKTQDGPGASTITETTRNATSGFTTVVSISLTTLLLTSSKGMQTWKRGQSSQPFNLGTARGSPSLGGGGFVRKIVLVLPSIEVAAPLGGVWFVPNDDPNQIGFMQLLSA
jgi:hypothetical protein